MNTRVNDHRNRGGEEIIDVDNVRRMSNSTFIHQLMEMSSAGPMAQMIIIVAIDQYLKYIRTQEIPVATGNPEMINPHAWREACEKLEKEFRSKYGE